MIFMATPTMRLAREPTPPGKIGWILHELSLTIAQEAQTQAAFERHRPKFDCVLRETFPKVRAVQDEIDSELEKLLTPEQAQKFTEMRKRRAPPGGPMGPDSCHPRRRTWRQ